MDETNLINLAKQGYKVPLDTLLCKHYDFLYHYLLRLTLNKSLAEDLCQDTMVKAIVNIKGFNHQSKFSTWLISIATNLYKNEIRKSKKNIPMDIDDMANLFSPVDTFTETIIHKDLIHKMVLILKKMNPKQSIPFILKHYYGYDLDSISKIMACPLGTVKSRIHQTIKKLQKEMEDDFNVKM